MSTEPRTSDRKHTLSSGEQVTIRRVGWNGVHVGYRLLTLRGDMPEPRTVSAVTPQAGGKSGYVSAYAIDFADGSRIVRQQGETRSIWRIVD